MEVRTRICILRRPYVGRTVMLQSCEESDSLQDIVNCSTLTLLHALLALEKCVER